MKGHNGRICPVSVDSEGVCIQIGSPLGSMIVVTEPSSALQGRIARLHEACHFHPTPSATLTNYLLKLSLLDRADLAFTSDSDQVPDVVEEYFKEGNNGTFVLAQGLKHCGLGDLNCITNLHAGDQFVAFPPANPFKSRCWSEVEIFGSVRCGDVQPPGKVT